MNRPSRGRFVHKVDLYLAATEHTDSTGSLDRPLSLVESAITCLVTDLGGTRYTTYDRELERKKAMILFPDQIELREGAYLRYTTPVGTIRWYLVDSFRDDQDLGRLWVADCSEAPDPSGG